MSNEQLQYKDIIFKPQWEYRNADSGFVHINGVIPGKLFFSSITGSPNAEDVKNIPPILYDLYKNATFRNKTILRIADYKNASFADISIRQSYASLLTKLNKEYNCITEKILICGADKMIKAQAQLFSAYINQEILFFNTVEEAFDFLKETQQKIRIPEEQIVLSQENLLELKSILGKFLIFEESEEFEDIKMSESNPLNILEDLINVAKADLIHLQNIEKKQTVSMLDILLSLQVPILIIDRKSLKIVFANKAQADLSLTTPEEMIGKQCNDYVCPRAGDQCPVCDQNRTFNNEETVILRPDGSLCEVLKSVKPIVFQGKSSLIETHIDISGIKKAHLETIKLNDMLKNNKDRLALAMDVAKEGVWDLNIANNTLDFDSTIYRMAGYEPDEYPGLFEEWEKKVHPDYLDQARADLAFFLSGEDNSYKSKFKFLQKNDNYMWIKARGQIVEFDDSDKPIRYIGILTDITSQKMREKRASLRNKLQSQLIKPGTLENKAEMITKTLVSSIDADFARIWLVRPRDLCKKGCKNYTSDLYMKYCAAEENCLHLVSSSGRYTHINGEHSRVPIGALKIGSIFNSSYDKLITNDVLKDERVPNKKWAEELELVSFAGFRLEDSNGNKIGVLALFSKNIIDQEIETYIESIANLTSQVIINDKAEIDLKEALFQTERANNLMEGRENRIRQIKEEINILTSKMGWGNVYEETHDNDYDKIEITLNDSRKNALSLAEDAEIARREVVEINEQLSIIKQAVNSSSDAIAISTTNGDYFYLNSTFTNLFDYTIEQISMINLNSLFIDGSIYLESLNSGKEGKSWQKQVEMISRIDIIYPIFLRVAPFKDNNEKIIGLVWNFTDITEQRISESKIQEYTRTIEKDLEEKKSMLLKATMLQKSFIQKFIPVMDTLNIHALFMPCENLGGDFFRIQKGVHQDKMIIIIGDCTDHGIKASMDASLLSSLIDPNLNDLYYDNRTDEFLKRISLEYMKLAEEDQFPTMMVMVFDMYSGDLFYSNANSELPYLLRENEISMLEKADGMHIGYFENPVFERKHFHFQPGDRLFLYSDAIKEIKKENKSMLGDSGMRQILDICDDNATNSFDCLIDKIKGENGVFPLDDDATLILLEFKEHKKLQFKFNNIDDWRIYCKGLKKDLYDFDYSADEIERFSIAIDEMCLNAFDHGNKRDPQKYVTISGSINCKDINIFIEDEGDGFNPDSVPDPVSNIEEMIESDNEDDYIHGRGIWITKEFLDSVEYNKKGNSVRIIKQKNPNSVRQD